MNEEGKGDAERQERETEEKGDDGWGWRREMTTIPFASRLRFLGGFHE
jgi:hypothetical protein